MRRYNGKISGERYIADKSSRVVHDLDYESNECDIDDIVQSGRVDVFITLDAAHRKGYDDCRHCSSSSKTGSDLSDLYFQHL